MNLKKRVGTLCLLAAVAAAPALTAGDAQATKCRCRVHAAEAQAEGLCARTENGRICSLVFSSMITPEHLPPSFLSRLKNAGITTDPREAIRFAHENEPEAWTTDQMKTFLPALFAISMYPEFPDFEKPLAEAFEKTGQFTNLDAFRYRKKEASTGSLGGYRSVISRGCIELFDGPVTLMLKTHWSDARHHCDDIP